MMSSLPANWDMARVSVDPLSLNTAASTVNSMITTISEELNAVTDQMNRLLVSWTGDSTSAAKEAEDFNNDWNALWTRLFGTQDDPEKGILNRFANGIGTAALAYSRGERGVSDTWARWQAALEGINVDNLHLGPDDDVEVAVNQQTPPDPTTPDYTQKPPDENSVTDEAETDVITDIASLIDPTDFPPPGGVIHSTAVNQHF
jgi:hypothetical protein